MKSRIFALLFSVLRMTVALACLLSLDPGENPTAAIFLLAELFGDVQSVVNVALAKRFDTRARGFVVPLCYAVSAFLAPTAGPDSSELVAALVGCFAVTELLLRCSFGWCCTSANSSWVKLHDAWPYSLIRHPMAVNAILLRLLVTIAYPSGANLLAGSLALVLILWRLKIEEQFLATVDEWQAYALRVRWRIIPGVY